MSENQLALTALTVQNQRLSQQRAANLYNVSQSSLNNYITGHTNKEAAILRKYKLQVSEETALVQWILFINKYDLSSQYFIVQSMMNLLLEKQKDRNSETVESN